MTGSILKVRNESIHKKLEIASIEDNLENLLRSLDMPIPVLVKRSDRRVMVPGSRGRRNRT